MTSEQHTDIGRLLGIPDCCIAAFNTHTQMIGQGVLRGPCRTEEEMRSLWLQISEMLGEPWGGKFEWNSEDARRCHVPCHDCFVKVLCRSHPDGWVFEEDHDRICDIPHTQHPEDLVPFIERYSTTDKELSL